MDVALTRQQIDFLENWVVKVPPSAIARGILRAAARLGTPRGAEPAEVERLRVRRAALSGLLADGPTGPEVRAALTEYDALERETAAISTAVATRTAEGLRLRERLGTALGALDAEATAEERAAAATPAQRITALPEVPGTAALADAVEALREVAAAVAAAGKAAGERRAARTKRAAEIRKAAADAAGTLDPEVPEAARTAAAKAATDLADSLPELPSAEALAAAEKTLKDVLDGIATLNAAAVKDRERRQAERKVITEAAGKLAADPKATEAERKEIADGAALLLKLDATPTDGALKLAREAFEALKLRVTAIAALVMARKERFEKAEKLLARIAADAKGLALPPETPKAEAEAVAKKAAAAAPDAAQLADWDRVTEWDDTRLGTLGTAVEAAETLAEETRVRTAQRLKAVADALLAARAVIAAPGGAAFSKAQKDHFEGLVAAEEARAKLDLAVADDVVLKAGAVAAAAKAHSAALAPLLARIVRAKRPAGILADETAKADAAEKAARDALAAALP